MPRILQHFKLEEFACPCCGENRIDIALVEKLDFARTICGIPFVVTSGYRCPKHNKEVGGDLNSAHKDGLAADIETLDSSARFKIVSALLKVGFVRIGIGEGFVHCDIDASKPQNVLFDYYKKTNSKQG